MAVDDIPRFDGGFFACRSSESGGVVLWNMLHGIPWKAKEGSRVIIAEVSKTYDLSADTLRYYERIGLIPHVPRNSSGIRFYDEESRRWVEFVKCMRSAGIPIETLIEYVGLCRQGDQTTEARKDLLIEERRKLAERIAEMQETLARLDTKIEGYGHCLAAKEKELSSPEKRDEPFHRKENAK